MYQRIHKPSAGKPKPQENSSQFGRSPLIQPKLDSNNTTTQQEIEHPVYYQDETAELEAGEAEQKIESSSRIDGAVFYRQVIRPPARGIQMKRNVGQSVDEKVSMSEAKTEPPKKQETESTQKPNQKTIPESKNPSQLHEFSTTGLASKSLTNAFAQEVDYFWKNPANHDKPITDLINFMMVKINQKLPYKCGFNSENSDTYGLFDSQKWSIGIDKESLKTDGDLPTIGEMNKSDVGELISTFYHEARHSEQFFRMARMRAGQGKNAEQIQKEMKIPLPVAEAAVKFPLRDNIEANKEMLAEAQEWDASQYGKYADYREAMNNIVSLLVDIQNVYDNIGNQNQRVNAFAKINNSLQDELHESFEPIKIQIEREAQKDKYGQEILDNIKEITTISNEMKKQPSEITIDNLAKTIHTIYQHDPLERDAFHVGFEAKLEFDRRNRIKRTKKH